MRRLYVVLPLLCAVSAHADTPTLTLNYEGSLAGIRMIEARLRIDQDEAGYTVRLHVQTVGAAAMLARGRSDVISQGVFRAERAIPTHLDSEGYWNGRATRLVVDFPAGQPAIRVMQPPDRQRRRALTPTETDGATDVLGLIAALIRDLAATGRCDLQTRIFDGRGIAAFTITTTDPRRCDFTTRKVAEPTAEDQSPVDRGYALFAAPGPGLPLVPVKIVFQTRWTGDAVLGLVGQGK